MEANTTTPATLLAFTLKPEPTHKSDEFRLGTIPMPDSPNQKPGTRNELEVKVRYIKDGMGRAGGRGIFLTVHGHTVDGVFKTFLLCQDPSAYFLVEPCKRFSAKALAKAAAQACETHRDQIEAVARQAIAYYLSKTLA